MGAPNLSFTFTRGKISDEPGFDCIAVTFSADAPYQAFECRATKAGESWGRGVGTLCASFSATPANVQRTFEVYDDFLVRGDGQYRISLFAQGRTGAVTTTRGLSPTGSPRRCWTRTGTNSW